MRTELFLTPAGRSWRRFSEAHLHAPGTLHRMQAVLDSLLPEEVRREQSQEAAITVVRDEFQKYEVPLVCLQCDDPLCVRMCPQNAVTKVEGHVVRDTEKCIGCRFCAVICPYSAITVLGKDLVQCDLCNGDPTCVKFCATKAIEYLEDTEELLRRRRDFVERMLHGSHYLVATG